MGANVVASLEFLGGQLYEAQCKGAIEILPEDV